MNVGRLRVIMSHNPSLESGHECGYSCGHVGSLFGTKNGIHYIWGISVQCAAPIEVKCECCLKSPHLSRCFLAYHEPYYSYNSYQST